MSALAGHIYPVQIDWSRIIADLKTAGCTRYRIAAILGVSQPAVERWEEGSEPRHAMGTAILALHAQLCGPPDTQQKLCNGEEYKP